MESFSISQGAGRCRITLTATLTADGVSILLTGGEKSHIGGMVLCLPRTVGSGTDTWVVSVPGHKDVLVAEPVGLIVSRAVSEAVAVTAGIHSDRATAGEIQSITANCLAAAEMAGEKCRQLRGRE